MQDAVSSARRGDLGQAETLYRRLIALRPREAALHAKLGDLLQRRGNLGGAAKCFLRATELQPRYGEAYSRLGTVLLLSGDAASAAAAYGEAIRLDPGIAETQCNFGNALVRLGRHGEAIAALRRATALKPDFASAYFNLGNACLRANLLEDSLAALLKAVELKPDMAAAFSDLGNVLYLMGRRNKAIVAYGNAIALDPTFAEAYSNLANPLTDDDRLDEALAASLRAIQLKPERPEAHSNLGNVLVAADRLKESLGPYRHALRLKPDYAEAHSNLGHVLARMGDDRASIAAYREAVRLRPEDADAHLFLAMMLLRTGAMEEGWREYEWRWRTRLFQGHGIAADIPLWAGEDPAGKDILLQAEQGLGDTVQFARYATVLAARGARVTLAVQPPLLRLLATVPGTAHVVPDDAPAPRADYRLPLLSLPLRLGGALTDIPATYPYVTPDPQAAETWRLRLEKHPGLKVGLVWAGAPRRHDRAAGRTDRRRSLSLDQFAPLLAVPGVSFFSLQKGPPAAQLAEARDRFPIIDYMDNVGDFADTAALVAGLDLAIVADTSVAHVAGALGKPVWILSRFDGCWRWLDKGDATPWYPSARLFRQTAPGDWDGIVEEVAAALRAAAVTFYRDPDTGTARKPG